MSSLTGRTPAELASVPRPLERHHLLTELRTRGTRGGVIGEHRSMVSGRLTRSRLSGMLIVPVLLSALVVLALESIGRLWRVVLERAIDWLELPGTIGFASVSLGGWSSFYLPHVTVQAPLPAPGHFGVVGGLCALALAVSLVLPRRFLPVIYLIRFATFVQLTAIAFFLVRPGAFPYALPQYTVGFLQAGSAVLALVPLVLGLTYFPFDIALWRKVLLTVMTVAHLALLLPLQVALHVWVAHHLSLLTLPTLFFVFGLLVEILVFVAFYGWGMSWPDAPQRLLARLRRLRTGEHGAAR